MRHPDWVKRLNVASLAEAWIETAMYLPSESKVAGRLPRGGVDRNPDLDDDGGGDTRRLPRGGVDRNAHEYAYSAAFASRLPRGGVE